MPSKPLKEEIADLFGPNKPLWWRFKKFINIIDTPVDYVKEKLHGMKLPFGYELNISFMMMNRPTTWDIIRKQGNHPNDDPEDIVK